MANSQHTRLSYEEKMAVTNGLRVAGDFLQKDVAGLAVSPQAEIRQLATDLSSTVAEFRRLSALFSVAADVTVEVAHG